MCGSETSPKVRHLAVVMDGNQRWARAQGLPGPEGHRAGAKAVKKLVKSSVKTGIEYLTLFAFSSENWRRPAYEVELLMQLFYTAIDDQLSELHDNGIRLNFIGDLSSFSDELRSKMEAASEKTAENRRLQLNIAVNYGGQWDIFNAAQQFAKGIVNAAVTGAHSQSLSESSLVQRIESATEQEFVRHLSLGDAPAVDLFIRTSGEQRISNFLLWQIAYAELYFTDTYWPDFDETSLKLALEDFAQRQRRFGCSSEELLKSSQNKV
jgi:undecaprenyl diphosphate synthase